MNSKCGVQSKRKCESIQETTQKLKFNTLSLSPFWLRCLISMIFLRFSNSLEIDTDRQRQTDRQTDRDGDSQTARDRQTNRQRGRETLRVSDWLTELYYARIKV